jgi:hypothetical protein
MQNNVTLVLDKPMSGSSDGTLLTNLAASGKVEIAGRRYITAGRLAAWMASTTNGTAPRRKRRN